MEFASPIDASLQSCANTNLLRHQHLAKPLYTRQEGLQVKVMEKVSSQDSTSGNQPVEFSGKLIHEIQNKTSTSERKNPSLSSYWFQKWITSIKTQKSKPPSEIKLIIFGRNQSTRETCTNDDIDESAIEDSVSKLKSTQYCSAVMILSAWTTAFSAHNYNFDVSDGLHTVINNKISKTKSCLSFYTTTRFHTGSIQGFKRIKISGSMVIISTTSKGPKVKRHGIMMGGTKAVYCQDKAERGNDKAPNPETGLSCLVCLINKYLMFLV